MGGFELDPNLMKMFMERRRTDELQRVQLAREQEEKRETSLDTARQLAITQAKDPESSFQKTAEFLRRNSNSPADHLLVDALEAEYKKAGKAAKAQEAQGALSTDRAAQMRPGGGGPVVDFSGIDRTQRNWTQNAPGMNRDAVIRQLREQDPRGLAEINRAAIGEQLQAAGRTVGQLGDIETARRQSIKTSQVERNLDRLRERGMISSKEEASIRRGMLNTAAFGATTRNIAINMTMERYIQTVATVNDFAEGVAITDRMIEIGEDPSTLGFAASVRNLIQRGAGRIQGLAMALGGDLGEGLLVSESEMSSLLASGSYEVANEKEEERAAWFRTIINDDKIGEMELLELLLAFKIERAVTGGRRFSVQAVDRIARQINVKDRRGERQILGRLKVARAIFKSKMKRTNSEMQKYERIMSGNLRQGEPLFERVGVPDVFQPPASEPPVGPDVYIKQSDGTLRPSLPAKPSGPGAGTQR